MKPLTRYFVMVVCVFGWLGAADAAAEDTLTPHQQIHAHAQAFAEAFNRGDAQAVAALWTEDGDYIDEAGQRFAGRKAIEDEYAAFFAANPGAKITLAVDSIRLLGDNVAVEDGRADVSLPKGSPSQSRYSAVHVNSDGKWQMATVRDTRIDVPSSYGHLADLEFLVGKWQAEHRGRNLQLDCEWIAGKSFLERTLSVTDNGHPVSSTTEIIGWDPVVRAVRNWTFSSDGGYSTGVWTPHEKGWMIETAGVLEDGTVTAAVYVLSYVDDDALAWKSVRRSRDGLELPDTQELIIKRVPADK